MESKGILNTKLKDYYEDGSLIGYRQIFREAVMLYEGKNFSKILDIGCGIGSFIEAVTPFGYDNYGLEASEYGLKRCKEKGINCSSFFLQKNTPLPFNDNFFSLVVMNQVIEHVDKPTGQYYIKEILRVLEPGGVAIIKSPSAYCKIWRTDPHHVYCWKPNELKDEIKKHSNSIKKITQHRVALEPWMFQNYNEKAINRWHKNVQHPILKEMISNFAFIIDKIAFRLFKTNRLQAAANFNFVKK